MNKQIGGVISKKGFLCLHEGEPVVPLKSGSEFNITINPTPSDEQMKKLFESLRKRLIELNKKSEED